MIAERCVSKEKGVVRRRGVVQEKAYGVVESRSVNRHR